MPARLPERLTPLAASLGLQPLFGDIHNHCALSYGHGRLEDALERASLQLDFVSVTGHADWPDMPTDVPEVAHIVDFHTKGFAKLRQSWTAHFNTLRRFERAGSFSVFPGYEIHSSAHGDYTVVFADLDAAPLQIAASPGDLKQALASLGDRAFAFPHHIGYRSGARGINWETFDEALSPFVEIFSMHGCATTSENDRSYLHSMGPIDGHSTMAWGLSQGHVFGIVGNTDHHSAFPGSWGHGRTGVYAEGQDRDAIWDAMRQRRTNALTGDNTHLIAAIDGTVQGGIVEPSADATLKLEAVAGGFIDAIDVVRNGRLCARVSPDLTPSEIDTRSDGRMETVLQLDFGWGARGKSHDWTGEIRVECGDILAAEPRFRGSEIVSPLDGEDNGHGLPNLDWSDGRVSFSFTAEANPNNVTPATQGLAIRIAVQPDAVIHANLCGQSVSIPVARLFEGSVSGNLGPIDSPAYQFHQLPLARQWQWQGDIALGALTAGDNIHVRLRQANGQMAWASPVFCRSGST